MSPHDSLQTIEFIPQSADGMLWEIERVGAMEAAEDLGFQVSWSAPTSESDATGQVSLIERAGLRGYKGLVVAPNHPRAILEPVRRVLELDLPVVIVSTQLDLPSSRNLSYVVNDDAKMGALAATEVARLIGGKGSVALVGLSRSAPGVNARARGAEGLLAREFPDIQVVSRRGGAFSASSAQETTTSMLAQRDDLRAVLSFTANSTRGVHAALRSRRMEHEIRLVGCEQDTDLLNYVRIGEIDGIVASNTYQMAYEASHHIYAFWDGEPIPPISVVAPMLITEKNLNSSEVRPYTNPPVGAE